MTSNKFCCAMDIREVHEPVQSKLFSPLQQSGLDVTHWGAFSSGSLACAFAFGFGFGFAAGFDLGRAFLGITVLIRSGHKNLFN